MHREYKVEHSEFYSKAYSKGLYNKIFQSWNNECIKYKVEHSGK